LPGILHRSAEPGGYVVADRDLTPGAFNPGDPKVTRYAAHA
jgi:hypothetical protein